MKIAGVIQARMGSTRLPGKVMMDLAAHPLIWHIADRLKRTRGVDTLVLATTADPRNDEMVAYWQNGGGLTVRAAIEDDIAARLLMAAEAAGADAILKVNADCPLVDPEVMGLLVGRFLSEPDLDYVSNKVTFTWPLGLSAEILSLRALRTCSSALTSPVERELVCNYIRDHPDQFRRASVVHPGDFSHLDLSVDTPEDYEAISRLFTELYREGACFGWPDILGYLRSHGEIG